MGGVEDGREDARGARAGGASSQRAREEEEQVCGMRAPIVDSVRNGTRLQACSESCSELLALEVGAQHATIAGGTVVPGL